MEAQTILVLVGGAGATEETAVVAPYEMEKLWEGIDECKRAPEVADVHLLELAAGAARVLVATQETDGVTARALVDLPACEVVEMRGNMHTATCTACYDSEHIAYAIGEHRCAHCGEWMMPDVVPPGASILTNTECRMRAWIKTMRPGVCYVVDAAVPFASCVRPFIQYAKQHGCAQVVHVSTDPSYKVKNLRGGETLQRRL